MNNSTPKEERAKTIQTNVFGESRCPHCGGEMYYKAAHAVINEGQTVQCYICGGWIKPEETNEK